MNEETLVKTVPLPFGRTWEWYGDANVVVLSPDLDAEGRDRALDEVQAFWRRSCLRVVGGDGPAAVQSTQPMNVAAGSLSVPTLPSQGIRDVVEAL